jgi:hypothetical protein
MEAMWGTMTAGNYRPGKRRKQNIYKGKKLIKIYDVNSARTFQNFHKGLKVNLTGSDRIKAALFAQSYCLIGAAVNLMYASI